MNMIAALMLFLGVQQADFTKEFLLDARLPSVYLRFERVAMRTPARLGESEDGVWLRLRNNTRGAINLCTESLYIGAKVAPLKLVSGKGVLGLKEGVEVSVCYGVEARNASPPPAKRTLVIDEWNPYQQLPLGPRGDSNSISWIPAGGSILLSLPRESLANENRISIAFNYEWETEPRNVAHIVYFYASDLPKR